MEIFCSGIPLRKDSVPSSEECVQLLAPSRSTLVFELRSCSSVGDPSQRACPSQGKAWTVAEPGVSAGLNHFCQGKTLLRGPTFPQLSTFFSIWLAETVSWPEGFSYPILLPPLFLHRCYFFIKLFSLPTFSQWDKYTCDKMTQTTYTVFMILSLLPKSAYKIVTMQKNLSWLCNALFYIWFPREGSEITHNPIFFVPYDNSWDQK